MKALYAAIEIKPFETMPDIRRNNSRPGALVFDPCLGTGATVKASLLENKHRKLFDCGKDSGCGHGIKTSLLHVFSSQALNPDSITNERETETETERFSQNPLGRFLLSVSTNWARRFALG